LKQLKLGYLLGLAALGLGLVASSLAPSLPVVLVSFCVTGIGSSASFTHDRALMQTLVPERMLSRAHALVASMEAWGFAGAAVAGGAAASLWGARGVFALAGGAILVITLVAAASLARAPEPAPQPVPAPA
jgi:MFS family permease